MASSGKFHRNNRGASKLTAGDVRNIREMYGGGHYTQGQLSRDFGISVNQIGRIVRGESWQDIPEPLSDEIAANALTRLIKTQEEVNLSNKLAEEVKRIKREQTPGQTKADDMLGEISEGARARFKALYGE